MRFPGGWVRWDRSRLVDGLAFLEAVREIHGKATSLWEKHVLAPVLRIVSRMPENLAVAALDRLSREKHVITRTEANLPYLTRWTLLGTRKTSKYAVYVHRFQRSDYDTLHDHPWGFASLILKGGYWETTPLAQDYRDFRRGAELYEPQPNGQPPRYTWCNCEQCMNKRTWDRSQVKKRWFAPGRLLIRPANWIHRVDIPEGGESWSLVVRGPFSRKWGFWCPDGWRARDTFDVALRRSGGGDGCG